MRQPIKVMHGGRTLVYIGENPIMVEQAMENLGKILSQRRGENVRLVRREMAEQQA